MSFKQYALWCGEIYSNDEDLIYKDVDHNTLGIFVEGSDTVRDWLYNMVCFAGKGGIHYGFYKNAKRLIRRYDIVKKLEQTSAENVVLSGHSLGAASALVIAYLLRKQLSSKQVTIVLFGSPMPGGKKFRKYWERSSNTTIYNFRNGNDIVCELPYFPVFPWRHVCDLIEVPSKMKNRVRNHYTCNYVNNIPDNL